MTDTQALIERLNGWAKDADCGLKMIGAGQDLKAAATALTEAEAKLAMAREGLSKAASRFNHCIHMIEQGFNASGTLRLERAMKASQYEIEARACLVELGEG